LDFDRPCPATAGHGLFLFSEKSETGMEWALKMCLATRPTNFPDKVSGD
jgi:hypothetical protein